MGSLRSSDGATHIALLARHLVGRDPACDLNLDHPTVSSKHAVVRWTGRSWAIKDLGSRNGTWVDASPLASGGAAALALGSEVRFGLEEQSWTLDDASPPQATATDLGDGQHRAASDGLLVLPRSDDPQVMIYRQAGGAWVAEREGVLTPLTDRDTLVAGGRRWRVDLPDPIAGTWEVADVAPTLETIRLRFVVSRDEEHVALFVHHRDETFELGSRTYTYTLLTLARQRLEDAALEDAARGWVDQERLCTTMLRIDPATLNMHVFRARQHLGRTGVVGAAGLVQRRTTARQLRLGVAQVVVEREA